MSSSVNDRGHDTNHLVRESPNHEPQAVCVWQGGKTGLWRRSCDRSRGLGEL